MPKKKNTKAKSKTAWLKNFAQKADSPLGRLITVGIVAVIAIAAALINHQLNPDPYAGAQKAADTFFKAFSSCDLKTASKYYLALQNPDSSLTQNYAKSCKPGLTSFTEDHFQSGKTGTKDGTPYKNASYIYKFTDKSEGPQNSGELLVYMVWSKELGHWYIFSLTPTSLGTSSGATQQQYGQPQP